MRAFTDRSDATLKPRPTPNLVREIVLVLAGKLLALLVIWYVWFAHPQVHDLDASRVSAAIYSAHPDTERTQSHAQP